MVNSPSRSLHTKLQPSLKFLFELTHELFNSVFLITVQIVDVAGSIALTVFVFLYFICIFLLHSIDNTSVVL